MVPETNVPSLDIAATQPILSRALLYFAICPVQHFHVQVSNYLNSHLSSFNSLNKLITIVSNFQGKMRENVSSDNS